MLDRLAGGAATAGSAGAKVAMALASCFDRCVKLQFLGSRGVIRVAAGRRIAAAAEHRRAMVTIVWQRRG